MEKPPDSFPKNGKSGTQHPAQSQLPDDPSRSKPSQAPQPEIPAADGKSDVKKSAQQPRQEQQVTYDPVPGPQRP